MFAGGASCIGEAHKRTGMPLQDSFRVYSQPNGHYCIAIVSDGAGSAKHAEIGSSRITNKFIGEIQRLCDGSSKFSYETFKEAVSMAIQTSRASLVGDSYSLRDCHATIVAAVTFPDRCFLVHLGDGLAMAFIEEPTGAIAVCTSEPENGEASNETFFYTENNWLEHLRITEIPRPVLGCMLMSDGMEDFAWNPEAGIKTGFSKPIIERAKAANNSQAMLEHTLLGIVSDERTNQYTNDDKTLCLILSSEGCEKLTAGDVVYNQYVIRDGSPVPLKVPAKSQPVGVTVEPGSSRQKVDLAASRVATEKTDEPASKTSKQSQVAQKYRNNSLLSLILFFSHVATLLIGALIGSGFKGPILTGSSPIAAKHGSKASEPEALPPQVGESGVRDQQITPRPEHKPTAVQSPAQNHKRSSSPDGALSRGAEQSKVINDVKGVAANESKGPQEINRSHIK